MKIKSIKAIGKIPVYDISVDQAEHYILEDGTVTHNTGIYYSSNDIWFIGRQQEKDGTEVVGYNFIINIEKSRKVKEKSKIPINVTHEGGINMWSGMLEIALQHGFVTSEKKGWYLNKVTGQNCRKDQTNQDSFWLPIIKNTDFLRAVKQQYSQGQVGLINENADN
jgi:hypothetical protein